ncbi:transport and Golgi organization protein 2 [Arcicella aurantiaca]|uniref:Transport and Golgi organization protein 2 n=1 Tax=Arcicella aurantiaca TaxID=591202 RepID=A0A316DJM6_9BACT|nr:NRDE family protein [Arcicella aurantiaca]PWK17449.1 transport and Golgi organization protein 2 [Arcicella aurantiaca]
MCVLTYIPTGKQGFILTNNRDEALARPKAIPPKKYIINGKEVYFPKDAQAGGTWLATSNDFTLCLLNGAFEKHKHNPPYRQSRGQIILDFFKYDSVEDFINNYSFEGIENCTLIILSTKNNLQLCEFRWDGQMLHYSAKNPNEPHIWSSSTLYPAEVCAEREKWFADFREQNSVLSKEQVINFHLNGGTGDNHNDMRMNRNDELVTQCVFQVVKHNQYLSFSFHDLLSEQALFYRVL